MGDRLIDGQGRVRFGFRERPVDLVNALDFALKSPLGRPRPAWRKWLSLKRFQYFGAISEELVFGCALADLRYVGAIFVYLYRPREKKMLVERSFRAPFALGLRMGDSPTRGESVFRKGANSVRMEYGPEAKRLRVRLDNGLELEAECADGPPYQPMVLCSQAGRSGWVYAQKTAGVPVRGRLSHGGRSWDLGELDCFGHHDFSSGFMRRETFWNWACLSGRTAGGDQVGLNLSCGVNETSYSENCAWLDGALHPVGLVQFHYDRDKLFEPWSVQSEDGRIRLDFTPEGEHAERLDVGLLASDFHQIFGRFRGQLRLPGRAVDIDLLGFVEDHYSKW